MSDQAAERHGRRTGASAPSAAPAEPAADAADANDANDSPVERDEQAVEQEIEFAVAELADRAGTLFNTSKHAVIGALSAGEKELYTVAEAAKRVKAWLEREVEEVV